ncbi:MAG TPA: hypothetical protein VGL97_09185 [Bryobacteraceae bacterium]|jgi:hypothetical protein
MLSIRAEIARCISYSSDQPRFFCALECREFPILGSKLPLHGFSNKIGLTGTTA